MKNKPKEGKMRKEYGEINRVTVTKNGNYYLCQFTNSGWKCGKCLRGLINPFARLGEHKCRVCQAELHETISGKTYFDMESYCP